MVMAGLGWAALVAVAGSGTATPTIREMIELTDLSSVAVSPDGTLVAYRAETASIERNAHDLGWYVVATDGSAPPRRIADAGEGDWPDGTFAAEPPVWTADSRAIVYRALRDQEIQVWRSRADGSSTEALTSDAANIRAFALSPDSQKLIYRVGATRDAIARAERREYDDGVLVDARVDPSRQLYRGSRIDGRLATDRITGFWFAHGGLLADTPPVDRTIDLATGSIEAATASEAARIETRVKPFDKLGDRHILAAEPSGDGRGTAYALSEEDHAVLAVLRPGETTPRLCAASECRQLIRSLAWRGNEDSVLFGVSDLATNQTLYLWTIADGRVRRIGGGVGRFNGGRDDRRGCAVDASAAFCVAASANMPPRLVRIDLDTGETKTLASPNAGLERTDTLQFEQMSWTDPSGRGFTGQLMLPRGRPRGAPLFVTYYVCDGYLRGGIGDDFPLRQFADAGIAVLCANRVPTKAGLGDQVAQYEIAQAGIGAAIDTLAAQGLIDPARVGMGGLSFGGETTMWIATHSSRLSAISISNSLLSETYYWFNAIAGREVPDILKKVWNIGPPDIDRARWKRLAATHRIDKLQAPLLMQLPEREFRSNVEIAARLGRAGKPVELWAFPYETHIMYQPRHKRAVYERNLDWFRFWLQGHIDPDPAKADQYRRWKAMAAARS
ncbi:Atxe2 family lasso peptide isopeptidase [Sphingobium chungangianum]